MPVVGVVGGIGSGKSAVAARFATLGGFLLDADVVGHSLLNQGHVRDQVVGRFGPAVLQAVDAPEAGGEAAPEPAIDRGTLGAIVFASPAARKDLETIIHPQMRRTFAKAVSRVSRRGEARGIVLDAAILYETGWDQLCDRVVFVDSTREARLERVAAQRGWDEANLAAREKAQWPLGKKRDKADAVILNAGTLDELLAASDLVWEDIVGSPPARRAPGRLGGAPNHRRPE